MNVVRLIYKDKHIQFYCPGCKDLHDVPIVDYSRTVDGVFTKVDYWTWNGSLEKPTLTPSLLRKTGPFPEGLGPSNMNKDRKLICHSFIKDGNIQFLSDCTHELAGQTVALTDANLSTSPT